MIRPSQRACHPERSEGPLKQPQALFFSNCGISCEIPHKLGMTRSEGPIFIEITTLWP